MNDGVRVAAGVMTILGGRPIKPAASAEARPRQFAPPVTSAIRPAGE